MATMNWRRKGMALLGALVLIALSVAVWQFRFEIAGADGLPLDVCNRAEGWTTHPDELAQQAFSQNGLRLARRAEGPDLIAFHTVLGMENVRYALVQAQVAWRRVDTMGNEAEAWMRPRLRIYGLNAEKRYTAALENDTLVVHGNSDWHRRERVVELMPAMKTVVVSIEARVGEGELLVKDLRILPLRQRPWVPAATVVLLLAWIYWGVWLMRGWMAPRAALWRALAVMIGMLAAHWFFVFPQGRTLYAPVGNDFAVGEIPPPMVPLPAPTVPNAAPQPTVAAQAPPAAKPPSAPPLVAKQAATAVVEARDEESLITFLRALDAKWHLGDWNLTHVTAFFGLGLFTFLIAGRFGRVWLPLISLALLGETVPNLLYNTWDGGDHWDVVANLVGIAASALVVRWIRRR